MSLDLADEVTVFFDDAAYTPGSTVYPVRGGSYSVRLQPIPGSPSINLNAVVIWGIPPLELGVNLNPLIGESQTLKAQGTDWALTCGDTRDGAFSMIVYLADDPDIRLELLFELGNHNPDYFLATILKANIGNEITLTTRSITPLIRPVPGMAIHWQWLGGVLFTGVTNHAGFSSVKFDVGQVTGRVSVQTYVRGKPHSVKTIDV
jgi:hypothetical protein